MSDYKTIAESKNFIVLDKYTKEWQANESYQSEGDLEREFIQDLVHQGYEAPSDLNTPAALLANVRAQLQALNNVQFAESEWKRFVETWLDKSSDGIVEKTRKIHDDYVHDFVFDDGRIQNIYLLDKKNIARNKVQVIKQFEQAGSHANRYDVTILVNGLPLVQVELKKRGVAIREAFNQVHRYSKLRIHFMQEWFKLSAPAMEEALHNVPVFQDSAGLPHRAEHIPSESSLLRFRRLLERQELYDQIFTTVNVLLQAKGLQLRAGTVLDAALIAAPTSTKSQIGEPAPEMHQSKKEQTVKSFSRTRHSIFLID